MRIRLAGLMTMGAMMLSPMILPVAAGGQTANAPATAPAPADAVAAYTALLTKQCPQKHLEWLSPGELDDLIEVNFHDALPPVLQSKLDAADKSEKQACATATMGLACFNAAYMRAMSDVGVLPNFAKMVCVSGLTCRGQSDCARDQP
jgi:hypothetical protein